MPETVLICGIAIAVTPNDIKHVPLAVERSPDASIGRSILSLCLLMWRAGNDRRRQDFLPGHMSKEEIDNLRALAFAHPKE